MAVVFCGGAGNVDFCSVKMTTDGGRRTTYFRRQTTDDRRQTTDDGRLTADN